MRKRRADDMTMHSRQRWGESRLFGTESGAFAALGLLSSGCWSFQLPCDDGPLCPIRSPCDGGPCDAGLAHSPSPPTSPPPVGDTNTTRSTSAPSEGSAESPARRENPSAGPVVDDSPSPPPPPACGTRGGPCCSTAEPDAGPFAATQTAGAPCGVELFCDPASRRCLACASFSGLGQPGYTDSHALGISNDGSIVVGASRVQRSPDRGTVWNLDNGTYEQLDVAYHRDRAERVALPSVLTAVSQNGEVAVGHAETSTAGPDYRFFLSHNAIRRIEGKVQRMFPGEASGVSDDGKVIVGWTAEPVRAFAWTMAGQQLLSGDWQRSRAFGVSRDGRLAVGVGVKADDSGRAILWEGTNTVHDIGILPGGEWSQARAISGNAEFVFGVSDSATGAQAFRWRRAEPRAPTPLGRFDRVFDTDEMGAVVVGVLEGRAAYWSAAKQGVTLVEEALSALIPAGWTLTEATGVSADGSVVVGRGTSPTAPVEEGWWATLGPHCERLDPDARGPRADAGALAGDAAAALLDASPPDPDGGRFP